MNNLPNDWRTVSLSSVAFIQTGLAKGGKQPQDAVELPYLRVANVQDGYFDLSEIKTIAIDRKQIDRYALREGDVLLTEGGDFDKLGRGTVWRGEISVCLHQNHLFAVRLDRNQVLPEFFALQVSGSYGRSYFLNCAKRSTNLASINKAQLSEYPVLLPPLPEQRKIAEILSTWDAAIERVTRLIAALQRRKQGLMQRLLVPHKADGQPEVRLPGFAASWRIARFDEVFARVTRKNSVGNKTVLTASGQHGLISQTDYFNRNVASESLDGYYLLHRGEFAYNRSSMNGYPYGAIKQLEAYEAGVLSTLYLCFGLFAEACTPRFYKHFFEAGGMNRGIYSIAQEGARNHGLLNVGVSEFFGLSVPVPSLDEQQRLADLFDVVEQEIDKTIAYRAALRQQKQGLMQRLLTGQVRVPLATTADAPAGAATQAG